MHTALVFQIGALGGREEPGYPSSFKESNSPRASDLHSDVCQLYLSRTGGNFIVGWVGE